MPITFEQALDLLQLLIIIIGMILLHRSVPAEQIDKLLKALETYAKKTDTPIDDAAVNVGKLLTTLLTGQAEGVAAPAGPTSLPTTVTATVSTSATATPVPAVPAVTAPAEDQMTNSAG